MRVDLTSVDKLLGGLNTNGTGAGSGPNTQHNSIGSALGGLDGNNKPDPRNLFTDQSNHHKS